MNNAPISPSKQLAEQVVTRLIDEGLLRHERKQQLIDAIGLAELKGEDWRLEIELAEAGKKFS